MERESPGVGAFDGLNCAEMIASTYAERLGVARETAIRVACGFGGGIARTGRMCGAVSGAVIVLGLAYGRSDSRDSAAKELTYEKVQELIREVEERCGSVLCPDILGADLGTEEGQRKVREEDLFAVRCTKILRDAMEILEGLLP
jgi:C_GCAxxG_C_C family probable redox protein